MYVPLATNNIVKHTGGPDFEQIRESETRRFCKKKETHPTDLGVYLQNIIKTNAENEGLLYF